MEKITFKADSQKSPPVELKFVEQLVEGTTPHSLTEKIDADFKNIEAQLVGMKVEMLETPSSESLVKLYELQVKGRAYFERASEVFRQYLKFSAKITAIRQRADFVYMQEYQKAASYMRINRSDDLRATKSGQEREALITSIIPMTLQMEKVNWEQVESKVKVNYQVIKSYQTQFQSIREDILVQLSIIKNLIMLGGIKIDPESVRAFRTIEGAYVPTQQDREDKAADRYEEVSSLEEGMMQL